MTAKLLDISDPSLHLPEFLILDASIVLELTPDPHKSHPHHTLAVNFLNRLRFAVQQELVKPILPLLAFEECYFKLCKRVLTEYGRLAGINNWEVYYKRNPLVIRSIHPLLANLYTALLAFPIEISEPEDLAVHPKGQEPLLSVRMGELIDRFAVLPKDATILSEAERLGIFTVATLDSDWSRADGFTVIAPSAL
jgi:predicted nucleic acid-binding protein